MELYELYDNLIAAYKNGNMSRFTYYAMQWLSKENNNPFKSGCPAMDLFFRAGLMYKKVKNNTIDSRKASRELYNYIVKIAELNTTNPYVKKVEEEPAKEPIHILGILPEEEANDGETKEEPVEEKKEQKERKEEPAVEQKEEPVEEPKEEKRIFGRRKKR